MALYAIFKLCPLLFIRGINNSHWCFKLEHPTRIIHSMYVKGWIPIIHQVICAFICCFCSVAVMSDPLWSHELEHARPPCPSLSPGVCSNSCPLSWWYHLTFSSSVTRFSFVFNLSQHHSLFQWVSSSHQWPKYWSFSFSISPSNEYLGLISFRIDWFDPLAVQGTLKSLL